MIDSREEPSGAADARETYEDLVSKLRQAHAALTLTFGESREQFENLGVNERDDYMLMCDDLITEAHRLASQLSPLVYGRTDTEANHG